MKRLTTIISLFAFLSFAQITIAQKGTIELKSEAFKKVEVVNSAGKKEIVLQDADKALMVPKDEVYYLTTFTNVGDQAAGDMVITNPIPNNSVYKAGSATGEDTSITFSIDGGETYAQASTLTVNDAGINRLAKPEEYTHIRWVYVEKLPPQKTSSVSFETIIK